MNIIEAAKLAIDGKKIRRKNWPTKDKLIKIIEEDILAWPLGESSPIAYFIHFTPKTDDILTNDWEIYEEPK